MRRSIVSLLITATLLFPTLAGATGTVAVRDKGEIPLARPDSKVVAAVDPATGNLYVALLDLQAHEAVLWAQPCGCYLAKAYYGTINLVGWAGVIHGGHFKIEGRTWDENGGDIDGKHLVIIDLGELP